MTDKKQYTRCHPQHLDRKPPPKNTLTKFQSNTLLSPHIISQEAVNYITNRVYYEDPPTQQAPWAFISSNPTNSGNNMDINIEHFCAPIIHPVTGETISNYKKLKKDPATQDIWETAFGKEFGNMAQGDARTGKKGTNSIFVMTHQEIANIPKNRVITYARVVVDFWPQKEDPHHVRITAGGNVIKYAGELTTRTANLTTAKILWISVISTEDARFMGIDIKSFYLETFIDQYEYMRFPIDILPEHTKNQYNLEQHALRGHVYVEIQKAI